MGKDYSRLDKEGLLKVIDGLESSKRYGLVWDEESTREQFEKESENALPVLTEVESREILTDPSMPVNVLIEGDNYHALSVLNYTHRGKVGVIYIDPPYNTGNTTWKYNNRYVEKDDTFRHSKFLSFMDKRVRLAKNLLTDEGIIVCAIDDYECHNIRHLFDDIFGENNRLGTIVVIHNPRGRNDDEFLATMHEYMLVYARNKSLARISHFQNTEEELAKYDKSDEISSYNETSFMRTGNNSDRNTRPNLFYPIYYDPDSATLSLHKASASIELLPVNGAGEEKTWRWGKNTFAADCDTELLVRKVKGVYRVFKKRRSTNSKGQKPKTVWAGSRYDASTHGIMLLRDILGKKNTFPYPKSLYTVQDILEVTTKKDSVVLDFFAGSGTTGQAVLELNKGDGGNRSFILCTNNEGSICEEVCYPRIKNVIEGYSTQKHVRIDPLMGNLKYFKTAFVPRTLSRDDLKVRITQQCTEMLCLREGVYNLMKSTSKYKLFEQHGRIMAVYYALERGALWALKADLDTMTGKKVLYCFTLDPLGLDAHDFTSWSDVRLEPIPQKILDAYEDIHEY